MDLGISGLVAMVAAASKGIGFAVAQVLVSEGCKVSICARTSEGVDEAVLSLGPSARGDVCDVTKSADLERWFSKTVKDFGVPAILVTNTGGPPASTVLEMSDQQRQ